MIADFVHLNTVRDVLNMAEVPYVSDFYRALAALDAIEVAWNSAYDLPTPQLIAEVERLRAELAAAHEAMGKLLDSVRAYHGDPTPSEECAVCIAMREAGAARGDETR